MQILNFIYSLIAKYFDMLRNTPTILGVSWWSFMIGLIVAGLMIDFTISFVRGEQMERKAEDKIAKRESYSNYAARRAVREANAARYESEKRRK